jgi:hypothetical protein
LATASPGINLDVVALILWFAVGWRFAVVELLAELALGVVCFSGGGGGGRLRRTLSALRSVPAPELHFRLR